MSERGAISPERDEIVDERGAELSGAIWSDFEGWSGGSEQPRERGAEILTAQLRSHALHPTADMETASGSEPGWLPVKLMGTVTRLIYTGRRRREPANI